MAVVLQIACLSSESLWYLSPNALPKMIKATFVSGCEKVDAYSLKQSKLEVGHDRIRIQLQTDVLELFLECAVVHFSAFGL